MTDMSDTELTPAEEVEKAYQVYSGIRTWIVEPYAAENQICLEDEDELVFHFIDADENYLENGYDFEPMAALGDYIRQLAGTNIEWALITHAASVIKIRRMTHICGWQGLDLGDFSILIEVSEVAYKAMSAAVVR